MFVFCGENAEGEIKASAEGNVEWVKKDALSDLPVVEDLPILLGRIDQMKPGDPPFSARSFYENEKIHLVFDS
jgi:hypothetical protein